MLTFLVWNINGVAKGGRSPLPASDARFQQLSSLLLQAVACVQADILVLMESPFNGNLSLPGMQPAVTDLEPNRTTKCTLDIYYRGDTIRVKGADVGRRTTIQRMEAIKSGISFLFAAAHLSSPQRAGEEKTREEAVRLMSGLILSVETKEKHRRTLIAGDLNYNPYDLPIYAANYLHAVPTQNIAREKSRNVPAMQERRRYFYNPMWAHLSSHSGVKVFPGQKPLDRVPADAANGKPAGTYYKKDSTVDCRFWHCPDQVLLRPDLLPFWNDDHLAIVTQIDTTSLVTQEGLPDKKNLSDHLPLLFSLHL